MKKIAKNIFATALLFAPFSAFGFETATIINSTTKAWSNDIDEVDKFEDLDFDNRETLTLSAKQPLKNDGSQYIAVEGNVAYKYVNDATGHSDDLTTADLTLLKYTGVFELGDAKSVMNIGRFFVSDYTGLVFAQTSDGAMFQHLENKAQASVYAGWTGLLNAQNVTMLDSTEFSYDRDKLYDFASSYFVGSMSLSFPYVIFNQTLSAECISLFGTDGINGDNSQTWRLYGTVALNGPLASNVFYTAYSTFAKEAEKDMMNLSALMLDFYPGYKDIDIGASFYYATAEKDGKSAFKGITSQTATLSFEEPQYSALLKAGSAFSIKPIPSILAKLGADAVFAYHDEEGKMAPNGNLGYHGFQVFVNASYQIFTDLKANLSFSDFIGKEKMSNKIMGTFGLTLAL